MGKSEIWFKAKFSKQRSFWGRDTITELRVAMRQDERVLWMLKLGRDAPRYANLQVEAASQYGPIKRPLSIAP